MVKLNREDAKVFVQDLLKENSNNNEFRKNLLLELNTKIDFVKLNSLFLNSKDDLLGLTDDELYHLMKFLHKMNKQYKLNNYEDIELINDFSTNEVNSFNQVFIENKKNVIDSTTISNVYEVERDKEYVCVNISYQKLAELYNKGILKYNRELQRENKIKTIGNKVIKLPMLYPHSISGISEKMLLGKFIPNMLTFAVIGDDPLYEYDSKTNQFSFKLDKESSMIILDGAHRLMAAISALKQNSNLEGHFKATIWIADARMCNDYIYQESLGNPLTFEKKKSLEDTAYTNILSKVEKQGTPQTNSLFDKFGLVDEVKAGSKLYTKEQFIECLEELFRIETQRDIRLTAKYIVEFFNELTGILEGDFKDINRSKLTRVVTYSNMLPFYLAIAEKIHCVNDWQDKLEIILDNLDFDKKNEVWDSFKATSIRNEKKFRKRAYEYARECVKEML